MERNKSNTDTAFIRGVVRWRVDQPVQPGYCIQGPTTRVVQVQQFYDIKEVMQPEEIIPPPLKRFQPRVEYEA